MTTEVYGVRLRKMVLRVLRDCICQKCGEVCYSRLVTDYCDGEYIRNLYEHQCPSGYRKLVRPDPVAQWIRDTRLTYSINVMETSNVPITPLTIVILTVFRNAVRYANSLSVYHAIMYEYASINIPFEKYVAMLIDVYANGLYGSTYRGMGFIDAVIEKAKEMSTSYTILYMQDLWEMETPVYTNSFQWLPREMVDDTLALL